MHVSDFKQTFPSLLARFPGFEKYTMSGPVVSGKRIPRPLVEIVSIK